MTIPTGAKPCPPPAKPGIIFNAENHLYKMNAGKNSPDYSKVTGVTSVIGRTLVKPGLEDWKVRQVATAVRFNMADVLSAHADVSAGRMHPQAFDQFLVNLSNAKRDKAAARGTAVHELSEKIVHGEQIELPKQREVQKPVNHYLEWVDAWDVEPILTERQCGSRKNWYAGTFDLIAKFHAGPYKGQTWMVDLKTSTKVRAETALQAIAYTNAEFYVDENQQDQPMPVVQGIGVLHLTNRDWDFYDLGSMSEASREFEAILLLHHSAKRRDALIERKTP